MDFILSKPRILDEFSKKGVREWVVWPTPLQLLNEGAGDGVDVEVANHVGMIHITEETQPVEMQILAPLPNFEVEVTNRLAEIREMKRITMEQRLDSVEEDFQLGLMDEAKRNEWYRKLDDERLKDAGHFYEVEIELAKRYESRRAVYERARIEYEEKRAKVIETYHQCFSPSILHIVKEKLDAGQFRWAWGILNIRYGGMQGGELAVESLEKVIDNLAYDPRMSMSSLFEKMETLFSQLETIGNGYSDTQKAVKYRRAFERSQSRSFDDIFRTRESNPEQSLQQLVAVLLNRERMLDADKSVNRYKAANNPSGRDGNYAVMLHQATAKKERIERKSVCHKCGKPGHKAVDCWSDHECSICGKVGHIEKFCRAQKIEANKTSVYEARKEKPAMRKVSIANIESVTDSGQLTKNFMARSK